MTGSGAGGSVTVGALHRVMLHRLLVEVADDTLDCHALGLYVFGVRLIGCAAMGYSQLRW